MSLHARPIAHSLRLGFLSSSLFHPHCKDVKHNAVSGRRVCSRLCSTAVQELGFEGDGPHDDAKATEKDNALRQALSQLATEFGKESMLSLHKFFSSRREPVISTGSLKLDLALGIGGLPKGRIVEIYGQEASGKTTLALHIIKEAQKLGGYCAYFDVENAMDPALAESMGVNTENLLFFHPNSAENMLSAVDTLTKSGSIDVIVVDSVAALVSQCELDEPMGSKDKDLQSRIMTQALRKLQSSLSQSRTLIVFVNQIRVARKSGKPFEPAGEVTCGGNALKFYAAVRLRLFRMGLLKADDRVTGLGICVQVVKSKLAPAMKKAELGIQFGKGFCLASEVMDLACKHGIILQEGNNYHFDGEVFCSKHEVQQYLDEHEEVLHRIATMLRNRLFKRDT